MTWLVERIKRFWTGPAVQRFIQEFKLNWKRRPNLVTEGRILGAPLVFLLYVCSHSKLYLAAAIVFAVVAFTDWVDGWMARRKDPITNKDNTTLLGEMLDPIADKLAYTIALVALCVFNPLVLIPTCVIVARDYHVNDMRKYADDHGCKVAVSYLGKVKTTVLGAAITLLFFPAAADIGSGWFIFIWSVVAVGIVLTVVTWFDYMKVFSRLGLESV